MRMKHLVQIGLLSSVVVAVTACGTMQNYQKAVNSWNGAPERALVREWGNPTDTSRLANGNEVLIYHVAERDETRPKMYTPNEGVPRISPQGKTNMLSHTPAIIPRGEDSFWCDTRFEVNPEGMIVNTHFEGNNCVASDAKVNKLAFPH